MDPTNLRADGVTSRADKQDEKTSDYDGPDVWTVAWQDRDEKGTRKGVEWCATNGGAEPSPEAFRDHTACDHWITLRIGGRMGKPTCRECIAILRAEVAR